MNGILAIWNDCAPGAEPDYERWYTSEHFVERLNVPGFLRGWRYEAVAADPRFFTYYETETVEVLSSPAYIERLDHPTRWTRRIMQSAFRLVSRTVCELTACSGTLVGAHVVTLRWDPSVRHAAAGEVAMRLAACDEVARVQAWTVAQMQTPESEEARVRGGQDALMGGAIVVDCLREADARTLSTRLTTEGYLDALGCADRYTVGIYRLLCMLPRAR